MGLMSEELQSGQKLEKLFFITIVIFVYK